MALYKIILSDADAVSNSSKDIYNFLNNNLEINHSIKNELSAHLNKHLSEFNSLGKFKKASISYEKNRIS